MKKILWVIIGLVFLSPSLFAGSSSSDERLRIETARFSEDTDGDGMPDSDKKDKRSKIMVTDLAVACRKNDDLCRCENLAFGTREECFVQCDRTAHTVRGHQNCFSECEAELTANRDDVCGNIYIGDDLNGDGFVDNDHDCIEDAGFINSFCLRRARSSADTKICQFYYFNQVEECRSTSLTH